MEDVCSTAARRDGIGILEWCRFEGVAFNEHTAAAATDIVVMEWLPD